MNSAGTSRYETHRDGKRLAAALASAGALQAWLKLTGLAIAVGVAYFLAARLSLALLTKPDGVAVFWPAAGVSVGALIGIGPRARVPVIAGTIVATVVANILGDRNLWSALVFGLCNAGEAMLVAWLIERYFGSPFSLDRLRDVLGLAAAAIAASAVSGVGGTLGYIFFHTSTASSLTIWHHWFASDALGIITVAPLLIGFVDAGRNPPPRAEVVEGAAVLAMLTVLNGLHIQAPRETWAVVMLTASIIPLLLWVSARCRPIFAAAAAFISSLTSVWLTTFGVGVFGDPNMPMEERILSAQAGIVAITLCALVLAALFAERREHEAILVESEARLQEALTAGAVIAFDWEAHTDFTRRSGNAARILGFDPEQAFTSAGFLDRIHPDDRASFKAQVRGVRPDKPSYVLTFRFLRPDDGREVWLEETAQAEFNPAGRLARVKGLTCDITTRRLAEMRHDAMTAELDHRVKNVLARVLGVVAQTREGSHLMDDFVKALDGRIHSMAAAHSLLSQNRWNAVGLADLVRSQLAPYATQANASASGPDITVTAATTPAVAMVLHELVTNAAKYGALSTPDGRVSVTWDAPSDTSVAGLTIEWREIGGPPVTNPARFGFGSNLIRELIPHELGGTVELAFNPDGVYCQMKVPLESVSDEYKQPSHRVALSAVNDRNAASS